MYAGVKCDDGAFCKEKHYWFPGACQEADDKTKKKGYQGIYTGRTELAGGDNCLQKTVIYNAAAPVEIVPDLRLDYLYWIANGIARGKVCGVP